MAHTIWAITVNKEGKVIIPPDLVKRLAWEKDTLLQWHISDDGSLSFTRADQASDQCSPEQQDAT